MTIICGSDLSAASLGALEVARGLAARRGEPAVLLVHIADQDTPQATLEQRRAELDAIAGQYTVAPTVRAELVIGPLDEALLGFTETEGGDLLVIAYRSSETGKAVGSAAAQIVAHAHVPVVCVRDPAPWLAFARGERPLRILLGVDDSATCDLSIQWLHALRKLGPIDVVLGAIYYPDDASEHYGIPSDSMVDRHPAIEALLGRDLIRRFGGDPAGVVARPRIGLGRIGDHVLELAEEEKVDAILIGTGQKTGLGRLGSVSSVIVHDGDFAVVCVPPQAQIPTITVPIVRGAMAATDLSPFANRAVGYAFGITEPDGEVHIVHVLKEDAEVDEAELERSLAALAPEGAKQKVHPHVVRGDDAASTLAQTAARHGVDVICISSHGRSGIARALVGSVADRLLRETRLPVLVLRPS